MAVVGTVGSGKVCCLVFNYMIILINSLFGSVALVLTTTVSTEGTAAIGWISRY